MTDDDAQTPEVGRPAGGGPVEHTVGRPVPEPHVCDDCGHCGTEPSATESYCGHCGATVPYPEEDHCAECGHDNCMLLACPECGGQFRPGIELVDDSMTPNA